MSKSELTAAIGANLEFDKDLAPLTSFRTGGRARYFLTARSTDQVAHAAKAARTLGLPCFFLGGGSNVLVSDDGYDGLVIKVDVGGLKLIGNTDVESGAGEMLQALVDFATDHALTGLEFASGIWGTVGGAICGNAGAFGGEIGAVVKEIELIDSLGSVKRVGADYGGFGYRTSRFKTSGDVVTGASFHLRPGQATAIEARCDEIQALRRSKHPVEGHSAGCFFKNIPDPEQEHGKIPAGRLLEEAGAKQVTVGGARVFEKHANIIVNTGGASSREISRLAAILRHKVFQKFGIKLEEEIIRLGHFDKEDLAY